MQALLKMKSYEVVIHYGHHFPLDFHGKTTVCCVESSVCMIQNNPKTSFSENRRDLSECMTKEFHDTLKQHCSRRSDAWDV